MSQRNVSLKNQHQAGSGQPRRLPLHWGRDTQLDWPAGSKVGTWVPAITQPSVEKGWSPWTWVLQLPAPAHACQESLSCVHRVPGSVLSVDLSGLVLPPTDPESQEKQDLRYAQSFHSFRNLINITEDLLCANAREGRPESRGLAYLGLSCKLMAEPRCMFCKNGYLLCQEHDGNDVITFLKIKENNQLPHHHFYPMNPSFFFFLFCTYRRYLSVTA